MPTDAITFPASLIDRTAEDPVAAEARQIQGNLDRLNRLIRALNELDSYVTDCERLFILDRILICARRTGLTGWDYEDFEGRAHAILDLPHKTR